MSDAKRIYQCVKQEFNQDDWDKQTGIRYFMVLQNAKLLSIKLLKRLLQNKMQFEERLSKLGIRLMFDQIRFRECLERL